MSPPPYVGTERRRTPRYYVQLSVESAHGTGTTIDVNEDGVRFETNHRFVYGEVLTLRLVFRHIAGDYTHIDVMFAGPTRGPQRHITRCDVHLENRSGHCASSAQSAGGSRATTSPSL